MNTHKNLGLLLGVSLLISTLPRKAAAQDAGLVNDWLRERNSKFESVDLGGHYRVRYQVRDNFGNGANFHLRDTGVDNDNSFLEMQLRARLGLSLADWVNLRVEGQHSSTTGDENNPNPGSEILMLYQGYLEIANKERLPVSLKVGRQELRYGSMRLVGTRPWHNIGRLFDAVKLRYERDDTWVDAFISRTITVDNGSFNVGNDYEHFYGVYASTKAICPLQTTDFYFLGRNSGLGSATATTGAPIGGGGSPRDIYTLGARVASLPEALGNWDYGAETAIQFGRFKFGSAAASLDHLAYALHARGGYTFADTWGAPRIGLEYDYASGDDDPTDGDHGTFDELFPSAHGPFGFMDLIGWQNIHHIKIPTSVNPMKGLKVGLDYHAFWLATSSDFFYNALGGARTAGGYGITTAGGSYLGSELDLTATYQICPMATLQAGVSRFFAGDYIDNTTAPLGGAQDANWFYTMLTVKF